MLPATTLPLPRKLCWEETRLILPFFLVSILNQLSDLDRLERRSWALVSFSRGFMASAKALYFGPSHQKFLPSASDHRPLELQAVSTSSSVGFAHSALRTSSILMLSTGVPSTGIFGERAIWFWFYGCSSSCLRLSRGVWSNLTSCSKSVYRLGSLRVM